LLQFIIFVVHDTLFNKRKHYSKFDFTCNFSVQIETCFQADPAVSVFAKNTYKHALLQFVFLTFYHREGFHSKHLIAVDVAQREHLDSLVYRYLGF